MSDYTATPYDEAEAIMPQVRCEVQSCIYNSEQHCVAREVRIGPNFASCNSETNCATFKLQ